MKNFMLEKDGKYRYEFYMRPVYKSNVDHTVVRHDYIVRYCRKLVAGSTFTEYRYASADIGNQVWKDLLASGYERVSEGSFA